MNTKTKRVVGAFIALILVVGGYFIYQQFNQNKGDKTIQIVIKDDKNKTLYDDKVSTDATKLEVLLKEMKKDKEIVLEYEDGAYGMYITGMGKDKVVKQMESKGYYWIYTSDNNKSCKEAGYCEAANTLKIADQDKFVFALSKMQ